VVHTGKLLTLNLKEGQEKVENFLVIRCAHYLSPQAERKITTHNFFS